MNPYLLNRQQRILAFAFFAIIFTFFTYPMGLSDFWWHMTTGRWIWQHMSLPVVDPFTYTYSHAPDTRRTVILQAYGLGQVGYYFLYLWFGVWGLLLFKAAVLTTPLWLLWRYLSYKGVQPLFGLILIAPLPLLLYRFDELRPAAFSFIGVIAVLFLIESIVDRLRSQQYGGWQYYSLPVVMLLWANLHRGFVLGWVILGAYALSESIQQLKKNKALSRSAYKTLLLIICIALVASLLNPNGYTAVIGNENELSGPFMHVIDEYFPLWSYAKLYHSMGFAYACAAIAAISIGLCLWNWRIIKISHWILLAGFIEEGFSTFRFSYFLVIMCVAITAPYYQSQIKWVFNRSPRIITAVLLLLMLLMSGFSFQRSAFKLGPWESAYFPTGAAYYIASKRPPANIFNAFEYGGYLEWTLYPTYKTFIDQRNLDYNVYRDYSRAEEGNYEKIFVDYNVNTVIFYRTQPVLQKRPKIVSTLMQDPSWKIAYEDRVAVVFVRKSALSDIIHR